MSMEQYKQELLRLRDKPKTERMLETAAILTEIFQHNHIDPIIVGGFSVELYTRSSYLTEDLDFVLSRRELADEILQKVGFKKLGKNWYHSELKMAMEIPDNWLDGDYNRVMTMKLPSGRQVRVIGIEDIICDRLRACKFWKSTSDCEWAYRLFYTHREKLDLSYLQEKATKDGVIELVNEWLES